MSGLDVLQTVGSVASILCLFIVIGDRRQRIVNYILTNRRTMIFYGYIIIASVFTIFNIFVFIYLPLSLGVYSLSLALLQVIVAFSTIGLWSPILISERVWHGRFRRVLKWLIYTFSIVILVGFWIISWPDEVLRASILTGAVVLLILIYYLGEYWNRIRDLIRRRLSL